MSLDCVIYCAFYSILFRGAVFSQTRCIMRISMFLKWWSLKMECVIYTCKNCLTNLSTTILQNKSDWMFSSNTTKTRQNAMLPFLFCFCRIRSHTIFECLFIFSVSKLLLNVVRRRNLACRRVTTMSRTSVGFYPRDAMLARVIAIATCLSVCLSVRPSRAGIVSKRRKLAAWLLHRLVAPRL